MSMIGEYLRLTAAELDRAIQDPVWALGFAKEVQDAEEKSEPAPAEARRFNTYKDWDILRFLLARAEFPVNVILGEVPFAEGDDWGYGPPRYLPSERVRLAAQDLRTLTYGRLISDVAPAEVIGAEVYPLGSQGWDEPGVLAEALEWSRHSYDRLRQFFASAAASDDAMLVWLD